MRYIHSQVHEGSKIIAYLALGVIVGSIVGLFVGYSMAGPGRDTESQSQIARLQDQISSLQSQLAGKDKEISALETNISQLKRTIEQLRLQLVDRERRIQDLQDQLSSREQLIQQYRKQLILLENQTTFLRQEINRIANMTRIVQSEEYLLSMTGTLRVNSMYPLDLKSTYFTTLGRQIKVELNLTADPPVQVSNIDITVKVYYVLKGASIEACTLYILRDKWEFYYRPQLSLTDYIRLDRIPEDYFGKVPLFIWLRINAKSVYESYIFVELKAYDVYPP